MRFLTTGLLLFVSGALMAQTPSPAPPPRLSVEVQAVTLTSDSSVSSDLFQRIESKLHFLGFPPDPGRSIAKIAQRELENDGYFRAEADATIQILSETTTRRYISATLRIREGEQYRLKQIDFKNNKVVPVSQLRQAFLIKDGDIASSQEIDRGVYAMRPLYAATGYMEVAPAISKILDDNTHTLTLQVDVQEGPQFTVAGLTLEGNREWPPEKAEKLQALARSYQGTHNVGVFIEAVKQALMEMFPGYEQIQSLIGVTEGGEKNLSTVNVTWPEDFQPN